MSYDPTTPAKPFDPAKDAVPARKDEPKNDSITVNEGRAIKSTPAQVEKQDKR